MRRANCTIRDVNPARLTFNSSPSPWCQATYLRRHYENRRSLCQRLRLYATVSERSGVLVTAHDTPRPLQPLAPISTSKLRPVHIQDAEFFGRWQWLLRNPKRLAIETDFDRQGPARRWSGPLLVDQLDHHGDFELWSCLLQHVQRIEGDTGVQKLWNAFWGRKSLYRSKQLPDTIFWSTILEAALRLNDEKFLNSIYLYAEFMGEVHNTPWPDLYTTVIPHFLRTGQHAKAVKWHLRLVPNFYPGSQEFIGMMQEFSSDHTLAASFTLQSLYIASPERRLYDVIVPHLYGRGQSNLARLWRTFFIGRDDGPRVYAPSRQFLRYLRGYFRHVTLHPQEEAALESPSQSLPGEDEQQIELSREFVNHVHGKTFGFTAKTYNDKLGARWFASSWVGLDFATSVVAALGIQEIGPLSLQSICLREQTSPAVLARIAQLEIAGISIPKTAYATTVQHFARTGDDELLMRLLQCDIHPDVFDDMELQAKLMVSSSSAGDLSTYTMLLASRLACITDSTRTAANTMLQTQLARTNYDAVLHILDDVRGVGVPVDAATCESIFAWIQRNVGWHRRELDPHQLKYALAICRRLNSMDIPIPVSCWERITYGLGRTGFLEELFGLAVELTEFYTIRESARPGFMPVNKVDVPDQITKPLEEVDNLIGLYIPSDTPTKLRLHPLKRIFTPKWQSDVIRWSFRQLHQRKQLSLIGHGGFGDAGNAVEKALNVFRKLQECGVSINLDKIRKALYVRLAELYGHHAGAGKIQQQSKNSNSLSLAQMKDMIDVAWGCEILPPLPELKVKITKFDESYIANHQSYRDNIAQHWQVVHPNQRLRQAAKECQRKNTIL